MDLTPSYIPIKGAVSSIAPFYGLNSYSHFGHKTAPFLSHFLAYRGIGFATHAPIYACL